MPHRTVKEFTLILRNGCGHLTLDQGTIVCDDCLSELADVLEELGDKLIRLQILRAKIAELQVGLL